MKVKQDPITGLWCREDGAVLLPPTGYRFKKFRWTFGSLTNYGYRKVQYGGKFHFVHRIICRAFHGLPPEGKPFCDHRDRCRVNNIPANLHWVDYKENNDNTDHVDKSIEKHGVRYCEDSAEYNKAYHKAHREERKAYDANKYAEKKAQGLVKRKDQNGKWGWYPPIRMREAV